MLTRHTPPSIHPPFANYAHGVAVPEGYRLIVMSGQLGISKEGVVPDGAEAQAKICFQNISAILADAGADARALVRVSAFVSGRDHLAGYMAARDQFVPDPAPASTLMIVSGFARPEFVVEVEAIAAVR
ncbi:MAG: RidA family protein [Pseudomonadota bacterium]